MMSFPFQISDFHPFQVDVLNQMPIFLRKITIPWFYAESKLFRYVANNSCKNIFKCIIKDGGMPPQTCACH